MGEIPGHSTVTSRLWASCSHTHMYLYHQAVESGTGQMAVMLCSRQLTKCLKCSNAKLVDILAPFLTELFNRSLCHGANRLQVGAHHTTHEEARP